MENKEQRYNALKKKLETLNHNHTLEKYKILSEAYKLGKKMYGSKYSYFRLSFDFEIGYTTVKRICSLDKANSRTWQLIEDNKISSFKAVQVLHQHGSTYQDELIDMIIFNKLTTYDIRNLRCKTLKEVKEQRLTIAVEKGFARENTAYLSFKTTVDRLNILLTLKPSHFPKTKIDLLRKDIHGLITDLKKYEELLK